MALFSRTFSMCLQVMGTSPPTPTGALPLDHPPACWGTSVPQTPLLSPRSQDWGVTKYNYFVAILRYFFGLQCNKVRFHLSTFYLYFVTFSEYFFTFVTKIHALQCSWISMTARWQHVCLCQERSNYIIGGTLPRRL